MPQAFWAHGTVKLTVDMPMGHNESGYPVITASLNAMQLEITDMYDPSKRFSMNGLVGISATQSGSLWKTHDLTDPSHAGVHADYLEELGFAEAALALRHKFGNTP